jgi:hypothetical protein
MTRVPVLSVALIALAIPAITPAHAGERDKLNACQAMVERAAHPQQTSATPGAAPNDAELGRCRQIIKEWTLRDSRMSVDEQGRPLR